MCATLIREEVLTYEHTFVEMYAGELGDVDDESPGMQLSPVGA